MHTGNNGGGNLSTPRFFFGVCSGTTNIFADATTDNAVGVMTSDVWTFQTTFYNQTAFKPTTRVNTTTTQGTTFAANTAVPCTQAADRSIFFCDIVKGNPNYSLRLFAPDNAVVTDQSNATFLAQMELASPSLTGYTFSTTQTIAASEGPGAFNAVCLSWDRTTPVMEVCDIAVTRFS